MSVFWLIIFLLFLTLPFFRWTLIFLILFLIISVLLAFGQLFFKVWQIQRKQQRVPDNPHRPAQESSPFLNKNDEIQDADFREDKKS